jgi:hypothetical protein
MRYPACDPTQTQASSSGTDMQTISDSEISSRGLAALERMLDNGPVHVIKDDRLAYVVLTEAEYSRLKTRPSSSTGNRPGVWDILLGTPAPDVQRRSRESIDADIAAERDSWDDR